MIICQKGAYIADVLAHEIQHVEQRHTLKNMITSSGIAPPSCSCWAMLMP
ncbi:MAG: M48 family metalloprotease [Proteobacteria bacterium]|nr:M48 family metalloprotease [Pseudomonadota bacterium]